MPLFHAANLPPRYVVAHRGARSVRPENTLVAFAHALEQGAHVLEMDVHLTADGELVVIHDDTVDRVTHGAGAVANLRLEEIRELDAGYRFSPDGTTFPWRGQGVVIPTLSEVFAEFGPTPKVIEIKPSKADVARALSDFLAQRPDAAGRVLIGSFHDEMLEVFRACNPDCPTSAGPRESRAFILRALCGLAQGPERLPYGALTIPVRKYGIPLTHPRIVHRTRELGLHVQVWTVNDSEQMDTLYRAGINAVTTDYPDRAVRVLASCAG